MAGVSVGGGGGARRALDAEINAVPMVDLMMVTISFLLITAVWSNMQRLDATANAQGEPTPTPEVPQRTLEVEARGEKFVLRWRRGPEVQAPVDVPVEDPAGRFPLLAEKVTEMWREGGEHRAATDRAFDRAVLTVPDKMPSHQGVALMDAVQTPRRPVARGTQSVDAPAFELVMGK